MTTTRRDESVKRDRRRRKLQGGPVREKGGGSDGTLFSLRGEAFPRLLVFSVPHPPRAANIQDIVSWMLVAINPVTALRATRMWREVTNYGAHPDL